MMTIHDALSHFLGDHVASAIAGAAGGAVRWLTLRQGWRDGLASLIVGCLCSIYLSPLVEPMIDLAFGKIVAEEAKRAALSGFVIGVGGIMVSGFLLDFWAIRREQLRSGGNTDPKGDVG